MNNPEHSIIFSTPMVQALLNTKPGTWPAEPIDPSKPYKWMTRRIVKPQPDKDDPCIEYCTAEGYQCFPEVAEEIWAQTEKGESIKLKNYSRGDILWVRETWRCMGFDDADLGETKKILVQYKDETSRWIDFDNIERWKKYAMCCARWKPSIFMPREASRIRFEVKNIRIEKLVEITENDAKAEGVYRTDFKPIGEFIAVSSYKASFCQLWDALNARRGYSWESNPYVFVYEFMRVK